MQKADRSLGLEIRIERLKAAITNEFNDLRRVAYRLQSAFIHHGGPSSGHYFIYIYDFVDNLWRKYNDGYVTEVKAEEVFAQDNSPNPATPYFLVYVKDDRKEELVNCVYRRPMPEIQGEQDVEMIDIYHPQNDVVDDTVNGSIGLTGNDTENQRKDDNASYHDVAAQDNNEEASGYSLGQVEGSASRSVHMNSGFTTNDWQMPSTIS